MRKKLSPALLRLDKTKAFVVIPAAQHTALFHSHYSHQIYAARTLAAWEMAIQKLKQILIDLLSLLVLDPGPTVL